MIIKTWNWLRITIGSLDSRKLLRCIRVIIVISFGIHFAIYSEALICSIMTLRPITSSRVMRNIRSSSIGMLRYTALLDKGGYYA